MPTDKVNNCVRRLRFDNNEMTHQQLADKVGVTRQTIIAIEAGKYSPSLPLAFRIAHAFGGKVRAARDLVHGKASRIYHDGSGVFAGLPSPVEATRYHSLAVDEASLPDCLEVTALTTDGEIMGLRHRDLPVEGVQFHPESILTPSGERMLRNFLRYTGRPERRQS